MHKYLTHAAVLAALVAAGIMGQPAPAAPLGYSGGTITENFDTLPTNLTNPSQTGLSKTAFDLNPTIINLSGLTGWQANNLIGTSATSEFRAQDGSLAGSGGRGLISFGMNGSNERALGALPTSNQVNHFGLVLVNVSLDSFVSFNLSYVGEQWRRGEPTVTNTMIFAYGMVANIDDALTNVAALSFANPNNQAAPDQVALDGNLPANQASVSGSVMGLNWGPGQTLVLRWAMSEGAGQDNGMGIDNFQFTANLVPEPSTMTLTALAVIGLGIAGLSRRVRMAL